MKTKLFPIIVITFIFFSTVIPIAVSISNIPVTCTFIPIFNHEPNVASQTPADGSTSVSINIGKLLCHVVDNDSDTMCVSFYWTNGTLIGTDTGIANDTDAEVTIPLLSFRTTYDWYVIVDDSHVSVRFPATGSWVFTTVSGVGVVSFFPPSIIPNDITVRVLGVDNALIPCATVFIFKEGDLVRSGTTNEDGVYTTTLYDGVYVFRATAESYDETTETVTVTTDETVTLFLTPYITAGMIIVVIVAIGSIVLLAFAYYYYYYYYSPLLGGLVGEKGNLSVPARRP